MKLPILTQIQALGLPTPVAEHPFHPTRGYRFDLAWPDLMVALEVEGGTRLKGGGRHNRHDGYSEDCRKYTAAQVLGWLVVRATTEMVESGEAVAMLASALKARGV